MSGFLDIEKHIEDSLVKGLRVLFSDSAYFTYDIDPLLSKVEITMGKPRKVENDRPAIFVSGISYSVVDLGLSDGDSGDIRDDFGKIIGYSRAAKISFSSTIFCTHEKSPLAKNLSNETLFYLWFTGKEFMRKAFRTNINTIQKSSNGRPQISENTNLYTESVSLSGECFIRVDFIDIVLGDILARIEATYKDEFGNNTRLDVY